MHANTLTNMYIPQEHNAAVNETVITFFELSYC